MSRIDGAEAGERRASVLPAKAIVAIVVLVAAAIVPAMVFLVHAEREVSQYSTLTYESHARKAIEAQDYGKAIRICTGALKISISRSDFWGKAYLLRAKARAGIQDFRNALGDMETTARLWSRSPYYANEQDHKEMAAFGAELGRRLLDAGDAAGARRAISAGAIGSGNPVDFLYEQAAALPEASKKALWPEGPFITVAGWGGEQLAEFNPINDSQPRKLAASTIDAASGMDGGPCAVVDAGAGEGSDSTFAIPVNIPVSQRPFAVRMAVKQDPAGAAKVFLSYWFEAARKSASTQDSASRAADGGWTFIEAKRDFFAERTEAAKKSGYDPSGGVISRIGVSLPPGPAMKCRIDRVELFIPQAS